MNEWIIAPLLAADPTGMAAHRPAGAGEADAQPGSPEAVVDDRRHGDRRDTHDEEADPDFARGEDRRDDVV